MNYAPRSSLTFNACTSRSRSQDRSAISFDANWTIKHRVLVVLLVAEAESILIGFFQLGECVFLEKFADQLLWTVNTSLAENWLNQPPKGRHDGNHATAKPRRRYYARRTSVNSPSCWILSNSEVMLSLDVVELDEVL